MKRTLTSEDIEKEMRGGERKANQLYAQMNLKDDDLDEDTAEAFMFTIRQRTSVADDDEPRTSTADNHLPAVNELTIANEVFANSNGVDNRMDDAAAQATQVDNHDASPSKTAQEEKDDKSNKKGRQKKSPRAPSFCKLSWFAFVLSHSGTGLQIWKWTSSVLLLCMCRLLLVRIPPNCRSLFFCIGHQLFLKIAFRSFQFAERAFGTSN